MTQLGIEHWSSGPLANTLLVRQYNSSLYSCYFMSGYRGVRGGCLHGIVAKTLQCDNVLSSNSSRSITFSFGLIKTGKV